MTAPTLLWAFSTFALGGPQRRFLTLAEALGERYRHAVIAMDGCYDAAEGAPVELRCLDVPMVKGGLISRRNLSAMRAVLADLRPDLLLTTNWGAIEWFIANRGRHRIPHVHFEDGFGPDERADAQNPKRRWARRILFRRRKPVFVAPSHLLNRTYVDIWRVRAERVHLIPNGVDCPRFAATERKPHVPLTIGTVAALRREKRLDRLIDAFARADLGDARLLIVGDGPERAGLQSQARDSGLDVVFAGNQPDVAPFLRELDVFAMSSDTEQMPIGLVEAMAAGLPVAATDVGDIARMVAPENIPFITRVDAQALADTLGALATDAGLRARLGAANAAKARGEYDLTRMVARYDSLFQKTIAAG